MQPDLTKLAATVLRAHLEHRPIRLPAMTVRELGTLAGVLRQLETPASSTRH